MSSNIAWIDLAFRALTWLAYSGKWADDGLLGLPFRSGSPPLWKFGFAIDRSFMASPPVGSAETYVSALRLTP